jgi:hypothetical protein
MAEGAKNPAAEVHVKLVVDSDAKKATDAVKGDLAGVEGHAKNTGSRVGGILKQALGGAAALAGGAVGLAVAAGTAAIGAMAGVAYKSVDAFMEGSKEAKQLAGALTMIDQKGNDFMEIRAYANDLKDELDGIAMSAGATKQSVVQMFTDIAERGGKSVEGAKTLTNQMVLAGRAIPGGGEALAEGFSMVEMGIVRARNPIVQLIAATHTLKGSAKSVAKQMQMMTIDKQMDLAEKAIAKMAGKMKDVPLTLGEMKTSIGETVDKVFEETGRPIVEAMKPIFGRVREELLANSGALADVGELFGQNVGKGLEFAHDIMDELNKAVKANWSDISGAFNEMRNVIEPVFKYIYENKASFAKAIADVAVLLIKAMEVVIKAMAAVYSTVIAAAKAVGKMVPGLGEFIKEEERTQQVKGMREEIFAKGGLSDKDYEERRKAFIANAGERGVNAEDAANEFSANYRRAMDDHLAVMKQVEGARDAAMGDDAAKFAAAFVVARSANDKAAEEYVAKFLEGNLSLQNALSKAGPEIFKGGFEDFLSTLKDLNLGDAAAAIKKGSAPNLGIGGKGNIVQNFNGPINVKQDFRDQDPDRVAVVFKEEMGRVGSNRLQSRFAPAFGF